MYKQPDHTILIAGIGNTLRGDDGLGAYISSRIEELHISGVKAMATHQLDTGSLEEFISYDHIILVDAAIAGEPVSFYPVKQDKASPASSSHHMNAGLLVLLAKELYRKDVSLLVCSVKGENFDIGEGLSATAKRNADAAIAILCDWIPKSYS